MSDKHKKEKFRVLLVYPNLPMMFVPPLSIAVFTWILRKVGFEVDLFDSTRYADTNEYSAQNRAKFLQVRNVFSKNNLEVIDESHLEENFKKKIESFNPGLLLYSFTEDALTRTLEMLRISNSYGIPTVLGGVLATADPEWLISFPEVSIVAIGEGEETIKEVATCLSKGSDIEEVKNLWIKSKDGSIRRNPIRPYVDIEEYSTDFGLFDEARFERPMGGKIHISLPLETYRGCPYRCSYCNSPMHNKMAKDLDRIYLRRMSIDKIIREIRHLSSEHNIDLLAFVEDSFLSRPKKEVEDFIEKYKEYRIPFWMNTRPEHCTLDVLKRLKEIGLFRVSFGVESGNEQFRKTRLHRTATNDELFNAFDIIDQSDITYSINYMIGFPYETREMIFDTIRFAKRVNGYDAMTVSIFTPYRGTELRESAIKEGWLDPEARTIHTTASSLLDMPQLPSKEIDGLMRTFPLYVEFDESHWSEIKKAESFDSEGEKVLKKYSEMYRQKRWKEGEKKKEAK